MIIRGTTPYHNFILPILAEDIKAIYVTYLQNNEVILDKSLLDGDESEHNDFIIANLKDLENANMEILTEEEREMIPLCQTDNIATTPYSALASGRLSRLPGNDSKRMKEDFYAKLKYQSTEAQDSEIIKRVDELAGNYDVSMTEVSLAWLLTKVTSPIVGATKMHHVEGAVNSVDLKLSSDDISYLEEPYVAHDLVGVMADNKVSAKDNEKVWAKHTKIGFNHQIND